MDIEKNFVIALAVILLFGAGFLLGSTMPYEDIISYGQEIVEEKISEKVEAPEDSRFPELTAKEHVFSRVDTKLVAVDTEGNGVITDLVVKTTPGTGRVLVDIESLLFWIDTQQSIQTAKEVAEDYLNKNVTNLDLSYRIVVPNTTLVGGPSAGAAFAVATIATVQNKPLKQGVIITGTINPDGTIGPVSGVLAKGKAAKEAGFNLFLVPKGEGTYKEYSKKEECETRGHVRICNIKYVPVEVNIEKDVGIDTIEVENISEAIKYFI